MTAAGTGGRTTARTTARTLAADVLVRVWQDDAFAAPVLDAALSRQVDLDPRERGLATELTYGALRVTPYLEKRLAALAPRGLDDRPDVVRAHFILAAYQILFLDRVPPFAAVSEAVGEVRRARGAKVAGFVNAVLRKLAQAASRPVLADAIVESTAPWLRSALESSLGAEAARNFLTAEVPPPIALRVRTSANREKVLSELAQALPGAAVEPGQVSPLAIRIRGAGDVRKTDLFARGEVTLQEEGSQIVALALGAGMAAHELGAGAATLAGAAAPGAGPAERVLDACAGRGNKTSLLAELAIVDAADLHQDKLDRLKSELAKWNVTARTTFAVDWTVGPGDVPNDYDRVLVDAPCSGVGTLRRRPDLAVRRAESDLQRLADAQVAILVQAGSRARVGGRVVYAVCSVLRQEAESVVERALAAAPYLHPVPFPSPLLRSIAGDAPQVRLLPSVHGTDGYFLASFERR